MASEFRTPTAAAHVSVMLQEALDAVCPRDGAILVDATFGAGGYSRAFLEAANCTVYGVDRDPAAVERGRAMARSYPGRLFMLHGLFSDIESLLADSGVTRIDGLAMDLGVSSMQLDKAERGFSFRASGPLDMRMSSQGLTAADVVNRTAERDLADIIYAYGQERASRRIARNIVAVRRKSPISSTEQLAGIVRRCLKTEKSGIDPATRTFQALRIYVNNELGELDSGLLAAERLLAPGGRLAVVSFHSLEDRRVKEFLRRRSGASARPSRHLPEARPESPPSFRLLHQGAAKPSKNETAANPRARSARLRAGERTKAPAWAKSGRDVA